jgi:hypothetical protein
METIHLDTEEKRSPLTLIAALACALAVTGALLGGYLYLRHRHAAREHAARQAEAPPATKHVGPPLLHVYEDDAMIKGGQALIGGTVINVSPDTLSDITIELELRRRTGGAAETRSITLTPKDLAPDQRGRYELSVLSRDYSFARLVRIHSKARTTDIPFKSAPGAQRPPERTPQTSRTIIVPRPAPRKGEEEFINSPDNPSRVP